MGFWIYFLLGLLGWLLYRLFVRDTETNLPPGPTPYPVVGNVLQMDLEHLYLTFNQWYRKYGSIVRVKLFNQDLIVLNNIEVIRDALVKQADNFSARPRLFSFVYYTNGTPRGFIATDGWVWKEQRRFALHVLRDFGLGRSIAVDKIGDEIKGLMDFFEGRMTGDAMEVNAWDAYKTAVVNIINNMLFGYRYEHGDPKFARLQQMVTDLFVVFSQFFLPDFLPFLRPFGFLYGRKLADELLFELHDHFKNEISQHEATIDDEPPSDFTYAYLQEMKRNTATEGSGSFSHEQLSWGLMDLFAAGFETTATTLAWWTVFMVNFPETQRKMRDEIREVLGGFPEWSDKSNLPYCQAVLAETQRLANIVPIGVFHSNHEAAVVAGYTIPKDSIIMVNQYSVMSDEKNFPKPQDFNPDRFMVDGQFNDKVEALIPFSTGKRQCLGEGLARMELFLIATSMVWRYEISAAGEGRPSMEPVFQFTLAPKSFRVKLTVANDR